MLGYTENKTFDLSSFILNTGDPLHAMYIKRIFEENNKKGVKGRLV